MPSPVAATLWGFDLGLAFTTYITFSGAWMVAFASFALGNAGLGATLFLGYWLGRAASVWAGPLMLGDSVDVAALIDEVDAHHRWFHWIHIAGLGASLLIIVGIAAGST